MLEGNSVNMQHIIVCNNIFHGLISFVSIVLYLAVNIPNINMGKYKAMLASNLPINNLSINKMQNIIANQVNIFSNLNL
jgi:hypothetical protein